MHDSVKPRLKPKTARMVPPTELPVKTDQEDMTPTPEQTRRMQEIVNEAKSQRDTNKAYDESLGKSMKLGLYEGGMVRKIDGIAQRGKTRGACK